MIYECDIYNYPMTDIILSLHHTFYLSSKSKKIKVKTKNKIKIKIKNKNKRE